MTSGAPSCSEAQGFRYAYPPITKEAALSDVSPEIKERAGKIQLVLLDADGVLTDGRIYISSNGEEARAFDVTDGHGVVMGRHAGIRFGIVSGRRSKAVQARAAELQIAETHQGVLDKAACLSEIRDRLKLPPEAICFVGDDVIDVPAMRLAGFAVAPADAVAEVRQCAHYVTARGGGRGAVREVIELIMRASNTWNSVTARYFD